MKSLEYQTTVLLIENNSDWLVETCLVLQEAGYIVLIAGAAHEGVYLARRERPDLIVSETNLPDGSGVALCALIRGDEELQHTPFILIGELGGESCDPSVAGFRAGADDYFDANCNPQFVAAKVTRLIELKRSETALRQDYQRLHRSETHLAQLLEDTSNLITSFDPAARCVVFDEYQTAESIKNFDKSAEPFNQRIDNPLHPPKKNSDSQITWQRALQSKKSADFNEFTNRTREKVYFDVA